MTLINVNLETFIRTTINQKHNVIERHKWGTKTPVANKLVKDWNFDSIVLHHSGNDGKTDPVEIEQYHMTKKGWDDVGYHYLIHSNGTIYEGRKIFHKGSHVAGANTGKIGILLMGDFDEQWWDVDDNLSKTHLAATNRLIATIKSQFPHSIRKLGGHKEYLPNKGYSCPGNQVMDKINEMRKKHGLSKP
ncbi:peptidoglycan recognition protein family protein [Hahella sp. CR1]|uniref:peptidoglycan recognition protein family protein n=1 Tax=Hahella sp. CR1 TaxID=2992807 RepID=UPI0024431025|nr:peptidoglycan recognition family protein [Hahella sp. CR1]MDG9666273.1 peptidoglycan recognition protein family protein [Hahella sp. CR1]